MKAFYIWNLNVSSAFSEKTDGETSNISFSNMFGIEADRDGPKANGGSKAESK